MAKMREELKNMPPDQRAKIEAFMNANASRMQQVMKMQASTSEVRKPTVHRACMKKEDLERLFKLDDIGESCTRTFVSSSSSRQEMRIQCADRKGVKQTGSLRLEI